jgi:adenylate cyclase
VLRAGGDPRRAGNDPGEPGDRRVVTALFADLVGYVRMVAEHDPEVVRQRVRVALAAMADVIERFEGTREKFIGDAVFAVFGWPRAHDDDAVRAVLAALGIRAALAELGDGTEPLEVRIGIATGEVVTTARASSVSVDLALTGGAITTAARIQSLARPGEVLLDAATVAAARGRLVVADRGSVVLRGQSEPVSIHALEGELGLGGYTPPRPRSLGRLVGRSDELTRVRDLLDRTAATGAGGVMLVGGEAGIGKTRLLAEIEVEARSRGFAWTWTDNTSYGQSEPYRFARVFAQAVADEHGVDSGTYARMMLFTPDLDEADVRRFGGAVAAIARDAAFSGWEEEAPDTPTDPTAVTATLTEVAARYIDRLLETAGPRVVVIDDHHWMDPSSVGLVEILVDRAARERLVVLAGTRPGPLPVWADWPAVERIDLTGLAMPETAQLATEVARAALGADDARRIHERTAGNPLFVTETVRALLDDGTLAWHDGRVTLAAAPLETVPLTLRAVLGARIDALPPDGREAIGVASVVGVHFHEERVADLLDAPLQPGTVERLVEAGLIDRAEDGGWRFSHPLIHDVAYAGLLTTRRRELHARLADQLEAAHGQAAVSIVAIHRAASGDTARAIPLLDEAASAALAVGAASEAAAFWRTAAGLSDDPAIAEDYRSRAAVALDTGRAS